MRKLVVLLAMLASLPVHAKSLSWDEMRVDARLDADGRLHVREVLTYVFDGDWNGGSRGFNLRPRHELTLNGVYRLENGTAIPLTNGSLSVVDGYSLDNTMLRWRSRLPEDPPFANRKITYAIEYTLANILLTPRLGEWILDHDFSFPEREGEIRNFSLHLAFDPVWTGTRSPLSFKAEKLAVGEGYPVDITLGRTAGASAPGAVHVTPPQNLRYGLIAAMVAALAILSILFYVAELPTGRFARVEPPSSINEGWLDRHVFSRPPEVIGAAWDGSIGSSEVAAVLARLTSEGKIKSRVEDKVLHMELLYQKSDLTGYDGELVRKMFFDGRTTSTDKLKTRYQKTGFNPASIIEPGIKTELAEIPEWDAKVKRTRWFIHLPLLLAAAALLVYAGGSADEAASEVLKRTAFFAVFFSLFSLVVAAVSSAALRYFGWVVFAMAVPLAPLFLNALFAILDPTGYDLLTLAAVSFVIVPIAALSIDVLKISESRSRIAYRKTLIAARNYFKEQLASPAPQLRDEWLPYILAFGLGTNVDRWFAAYSKPGSDFDDTNRRSSWSSSSSSSTSSGASWTGGGGAFGGAGATGSWVAAASVMASGVAAPGSSSSGGGSSSSSSSSSGGGSGGGW